MSKAKRVGVFLAAMLFLVSSVALSGLVIWQLVQDSNQSEDSASQQTATNQEGESLKGTKLDNFTPVDKVEKLEIIDLDEGQGKEAKAESTVTVHYTGALAKTGVIFESSRDSGQPVTFPLSDVIAGWTEGVPGMKEGGTRRLLIPAAKAYGETGSGSIPPNSDLVFDIQLISVQ